MHLFATLKPEALLEQGKSTPITTAAERPA
jgi:hypothetical protein